ncbi:MAG: hypothetical protein K2Q23_07975 [Bryobacteraceae bacterium]|nr:hypothetical protein [Bryobacteraceae bacterium]
MHRREWITGLLGAPLLGQPPAKAIEAQVRPHRGRPSLFLNGEVVAPMIYALGHCTGYRWTDEEQPQYSIAQFHRLGFRLFQADLWLEHLWTAPDRFSIEPALRQIRGILRAAPGSAVMLRFHVNAPPWWAEQHPGEQVAYANGPLDEPPTPGFRVHLDDDLKRVPRTSLASRLWREQCGAKTREFCARLAATPEGRAIFGLQIAAGVYGEWHYWGFQKNDPDTGEAMSARCGGARPPSEAYYRCQHAAVTDAFLEFCAIVKRAWPRPIVVGGFHGYWFTMFGRHAAGGHLEVARALASPHVDFLAAPQSYSHLKAGEPGLSRGLPDACRAWGKLWLDEMDTPPAIWDQKRTDRAVLKPESIAVLKRNVLQSLARGAGMWFYDLPCEFDARPIRRAVGFWDTPDLQAGIADLFTFAQDEAQREWQSPADVLIVFDSGMFYREPSAKPVTAIDALASALYRSGAAFEMIDARDLPRVRPDRFKVVLRHDLRATIPVEPAALRDLLRARGAHIWNDADGDVTIVGAAWLAIHTVAGGSRRLLDRRGRQRRVDLPPHSTTVVPFSSLAEPSGK